MSHVRSLLRSGTVPDSRERSWGKWEFYRLHTSWNVEISTRFPWTHSQRKLFTTTGRQLVGPAPAPIPCRALRSCQDTYAEGCPVSEDRCWKPSPADLWLKKKKQNVYEVVQAEQIEQSEKSDLAAIALVALRLFLLFSWRFSEGDIYFLSF